MISPESAEAPVTIPEITVAVQSNIVLATEEVRTMFVDSPEQMVLERGLFVIMGLGVRES
jgi:hypothetical protein